MTQLSQLVQYLDRLLEPALYRDTAFNGLQVDASSPAAAEVKRVAFAVDGAESTIEKAAAAGASLLVVHHGLLWGKEQPVVGAFGRKVSLLMSHGVSLYASHLPLDGHMTVGNNVGLAEFFGAAHCEPFLEYQGHTIGCRARFERPKPFAEIVRRAQDLVRGSASEKSGLPLALHFGATDIKSVAFVSGSGSMALAPAAESQIDLLISGEPKHEVYHSAKELRMNAIFCGHYRTETFGVRSLQQHLEKEFNVGTVFIDEDSGI